MLLDDDYPMRGNGIKMATLKTFKNSLTDLKEQVLDRRSNEERLCRQWAGDEDSRKKCYPKNEKQEIQGVQKNSDSLIFFYF